MAIPISMVNAQIRFNSIYRCAGCGKEAVGDTARCEFNGGSTQRLKDFIDSQAQKSTHMPVGWSFNGFFSCETCVAMSVGG